MDIEKKDNGVLFKVKVQPLARDDEIVEVQGDALKIKINAPPLKGKANKALVGFLARKLGVKNSGVEIISGHTTRLKSIKVIGEPNIATAGGILPSTSKPSMSSAMMRKILQDSVVDRSSTRYCFSMSSS